MTHSDVTHPWAERAAQIDAPVRPCAYRTPQEAAGSHSGDPRRSTAVLVGFETDVCVFQSAVGLLDEGLDAIVVEDATFSPGEMHERGLARLRDAGVRLTHCKALAYEWVRTVERVDVLPRPAPFRL